MPHPSGIYLVPRGLDLLQHARDRRPYSEVAKAAGCSTSFLWDLCNGRAHHVTAALAGRIEDAMRAPRGGLFALAAADAALLRDYCPAAQAVG